MRLACHRQSNLYRKEFYTMSNPVVTITMEDGSVMKAELYPEIAPNTVRNFISLIRKGFYNGPDLSPGHSRIYDSGRMSPGHRRSRLLH